MPENQTNLPEQSQQDLVSIITPAFRSARFIAQTIESVLAQDYEQWELLVVDDVSPDETAEIVERYARSDSRVQLLRHAKNQGAASARNTALEAARGRFIAFLDSDDYWFPNKLSSQLAFMDRVQAGLSYTSYRRISFSGDLVGHQIAIPMSIDYFGLLKNTAILTSTVVVDTEATGQFRMKSAYYDDFVLWLELLKRGVVAKGAQEDLVRYRVVPRSISRNKANSARQVWRTYRDFEGMGLIRSAWCFTHYAANAWKKYRKF